MRDHIPSIIQKMLHLEQERAYFNILSVGSGTGDMELEILKTVKDELHKSQGCHQMKIFNRAIELNKYPCDLYKAAIKNFHDEQTVFDVRQQNFEEYIKEFTMEEPKFDIIHFIHSIGYYDDIESVLKHCIENELNDEGRLVLIVARPFCPPVLDKQHYSDWHGNPHEKTPQSYSETAEKIIEIAEKHGWKHEVYTVDYSIDVTEIFDPQSTEGNLLLDFITHTENFRGTADKNAMQETLALIEDLSTLKDGKRLGEMKDSVIFIHK